MEKQGKAQYLAMGKGLPPRCSRHNPNCLMYPQLPAAASKIIYGCAWVAGVILMEMGRVCLAGGWLAKSCSLVGQGG